MSKYTDEEKQTLKKLARQSIEHGLEHGAPLDADLTDLPKSLLVNRATFVTLKINGHLRGCIGTLSAHQALALDVAHNSYKAAFSDPRFAPLSKKELSQIDISISVLTPPEPLAISSEEDLLTKLNPGEDGLILKSGFRQATFLPAVWEDLPTPKDFVSQLKQKAGFRRDEWPNNMTAETYHAIEF